MKSYQKVEIFVAAALIVVMGTTFVGPSSTGYLPSNTLEQDVNLALAESGTTELKIDGSLVSLGITGRVEGEGTVYVYLNNKASTNLLVYSNVRTLNSTESYENVPDPKLEPNPAPAKSDFITLAADAHVLPSDSFERDCWETCDIPANFDTKTNVLVYFVQPGTTLHIDRLVYLAR